MLRNPALKQRKILPEGRRRRIDVHEFLPCRSRRRDDCQNSDEERAGLPLDGAKPSSLSRVFRRITAHFPRVYLDVRMSFTLDVPFANAGAALPHIVYLVLSAFFFFFFRMTTWLVRPRGQQGIN